MGYKKYFLSFASSDLYRSLKRIKNQAKKMQAYDYIYTYNEYDLDNQFYDYFKDKLNHSKGFGYWVWKPQVILQILEQMNEGDILQYTDAGCHLNKKGIHRLNEYFDITNNSKSGILGFQIQDKKDIGFDPRNKIWTKGDLFDYFNARNKPQIYNNTQYAGGIIFIKKTKRAIEIIKKWQQVYYENFSLADDSPSRSPNFKEFIEHRHDQSIFSLLAIINNITTVPYAECWHHELSIRNINKLINYPILVLRDKDNYNHNYLTKALNKLYVLYIKINPFH